MKVLITGSSSLIGYKVISKFLKNGYEVIALYLSHGLNISDLYVKKFKVDITEYDDIYKVFEIFHPRIVVHLAAYADVDGCEINRDIAWRTNVLGSINIVKLASKYSKHIVYLSTDYVFDGERGDYEEYDVPNPVNYYGLTKLCGEIAVLSSNINYSIVRASSLYGFGPGKKNFAKILIEKLSGGEEVRALIDQYTTPTHVSLLAEAILEIVKEQHTGIFHIVGEKYSRYEFALKIAEVLGLNKNLIKSAKMNEFNWIAKRPRDSALKCDLSKKILKTEFHSMEKALKLLNEEYRGVYYDEDYCNWWNGLHRK